MINKRFLDIIRLLLKYDDYITINEISKQLNVSNKTIRNDLQQVGEWLSENNLELIKKTGVGITIKGNKSAKLNVFQIIQEKNRENIDYSPQSRRIYIGIKLILNSRCRIYELAEELFVSRATIHKDILSLIPLFETYKIKLNRKNNNGISIEGSEKNLRSFLIEMLTQDNGFSTFTKMVKNTNYLCDGSLPFPALDFNDDEIQEFLKMLENENSSYLHSLLFESLVNVMLYLLVTLIRIQDHHPISLSDSFMKELEKQPYYDDVKQLTDALEKHYKVTFSNTEIRYLQVFFISLQNTAHINMEDKQIAEDLTNSLLLEWENALPHPFLQDKELYDVIFNHLCSAITRFRHGIMIENPLMNDIESIYSNTFKIAKDSMHIIEDRFHCIVNDEEIGFFTLHLAASLERMKKPLNTLIVSQGSIGATNLLVSKLKAQFPELKIQEILNSITIHDAKLDNIDLILSTTELSLSSDIPMLVINTLLYDYDIIRLKSLVKSYYKEKNDPLKTK